MFTLSRSQDQYGHHAIYGKNLQKATTQEKNELITLKPGMPHWVLQYNSDKTNDDLWLTFAF